MADEIDIRRPIESVVKCPKCGMRRHLPLNWKELMNTRTITCTKCEVAMEEHVVFND